MSDTSHLGKVIQRHVPHRSGGKKSIQVHMSDISYLGKVIQRHMPHRSGGGKSIQIHVSDISHLGKVIQRHMPHRSGGGKSIQIHMSDISHLGKVTQKHMPHRSGGKKSIQINYVPQLSRDITPKRASSICRDLICPMCALVFWFFFNSDWSTTISGWPTRPISLTLTQTPLPQLTAWSQFMTGEPKRTKKDQKGDNRTKGEGGWVVLVVSLFFDRVRCVGGGSTKSPMCGK